MKNYFSHDYNSRNDKKLVGLLMKYGLESIGAYWCIVEMLYEENGYLNLSEYERITFELRTNNEMINYIINDSGLFENDGQLFWSKSALERIKMREEKSEKARISVNNRWNNTNVIRTYKERNTIKEKKRKVNELNISTFYNSEIEKATDPKYKIFVEYLYGANDLKTPLTGVLSITDQLTFEQFEKVLKSCNGKVKIKDILTKIENDKKYWKGKKSLYRTLLNWTSERFI